MTTDSRYDNYLAELCGALWEYAEVEFTDDNLLNKRSRSLNRSPVLKPELADKNIVRPKGIRTEAYSSLIQAIPQNKRHKYFHSLRSSQALAQSVFGGLKALGNLEALASLEADDGSLAFSGLSEIDEVELEHDVQHLGDPPIDLRCL